MTNMAKVICDKLATMTFSEQCDISVDDEKYNDTVSEVLENNCFWERFPEFLSRSYALGGGAVSYTHLNKLRPIIGFGCYRRKIYKNQGV